MNGYTHICGYPIPPGSELTHCPGCGDPITPWNTTFSPAARRPTETDEAVHELAAWLAATHPRMATDLVQACAQEAGQSTAPPHLLASLQLHLARELKQHPTDTASTPR